MFGSDRVHIDPVGRARPVAALITASGTFIINSARWSGAQHDWFRGELCGKNQVSYNSTRSDALNGVSGSLVDADLAKESAHCRPCKFVKQLGIAVTFDREQAPAAFAAPVQ